MSKYNLVKAQKDEMKVALKEIMEVSGRFSEAHEIAEETLRYIKDREFLEFSFRETD